MRFVEPEDLVQQQGRLWVYVSVAGDYVEHLAKLVAQRQVQPVYCPYSLQSAGVLDWVTRPDFRSLYHQNRRPLTGWATLAATVPVP